ncbi:hypothetical protein PV10_00805 [Exophiala mesophila]|uniref:Uncharacterized protein n=1 Tax=Exophiala mesophila TaxID=212818 RepID=A0A0D1X5A6_EXOME|nr:uncharacterized protein PV10_00805 [Exophiala mesophila]KIV96995.1 hypothetical protein PV10_00805 [Exophiala mesophila]
MGWYSILPTHLTVYETWIIRAFLLLSILNLLPWVIAVIYDILYYISRQIWHEVPIWGGRARGQRRPRAPTLRGRDRGMSFRDIVTGGGGGNNTGDDIGQDDEGEDDGYDDDSAQLQSQSAGTTTTKKKQSDGSGVRKRTTKDKDDEEERKS